MTTPSGKPGGSAAQLLPGDPNAPSLGVDAPENQEPIAGVGDAPPHPPNSTRPRRSVRVADIDKLTSQVQQMQQQCDDLEAGHELFKNVVESSRMSINGIRALQRVAMQEQYALGRSLQRRLATRLVERLKLLPPSGLNKARDGASQRESRAKVVLTFDVDADRRSMEELSDMLSLSYTLPGPGRRERAARLVEFSSPARLLDALGLSESLRLWAMSRSFTRASDGSTPVRIVVERFDDDSGSPWFISERKAGGELRVATRQTEEFDPQRRRFVHPLKLSSVAAVKLPGLPANCPAYFRWRPSAASPMMGHEEAVTCGRVTVSLPCCVVELGADELLGIIEEDKQRKLAQCQCDASGHARTTAAEEPEGSPQEREAAMRG